MNFINSLPKKPGSVRDAATSRYLDSKAQNDVPKIALFGLFGCGNLGNDGSLEAILTALRQLIPAAKFTVICDDPDFIGRKFDVDAVPIMRKRNRGNLNTEPGGKIRKLVDMIIDIGPTLNFVRKYDIVIIPGTGILDDFGERPVGMPFQILKWSLAFRFWRKKLAFVSIGAGPIHHPVSCILMKSAARIAHYRSYRDQQSKDFMAGIGLDAARNDPVYPDVAFLLPKPNPARTAKGKNPRPTIGIGMMAYFGWYGFKDGGKAIHLDYIRKMTEFAGYLLDHDFDVRFLTGELSDMSAIEDVISGLREKWAKTIDDRVEVEPAYSLHDLMKQIAKTDLVVATRFHNIVCSLKMGKPTISLGYAKKNDVLMESVGFGAYCQHVDHLDVDMLIAQFEELFGGRANFVRTIESKIAEKTELLEAQIRLLGAQVMGIRAE
jgi:polysaccharide pyruvyl transferase WcaK-like protein